MDASVSDVKRLLSARGIDFSSCIEKSDLFSLAEKHELVLPSPDPRASVSSASEGEVNNASDAAPRPLSISELKELLDARGIDHSRCLYRADLESLVASGPPALPAKPKDSEVIPRAKPANGKSGNAVKAPSVESLAALDGPPLFAALRAIPELMERRRITARVHNVKMNLWRLKPTFRGMAKHLTEDVHPMFRNAFEQVTQRRANSDVVEQEVIVVLCL